MTEARIATLHVHPLKGARAIDVASAQARVPGLATAGAGDREWMVVDAQGRFVTQREFPRLALVGTAVHDGTLWLSAPGLPPAAIALDASSGKARDVVVWRSEVRGTDVGDAAAALLSSHLDAAVRVVRFDPALPRPCNPEYAGDSGAHTRFADGFPILVVGSASLADLNARLAAASASALPMNRFRPNVVLDGLDAYAEDHIDTLSVDGIVLRLVKGCTRCQVTTTDQATARVGEEPLRTLAGYRMDERLGGVTFGMNAIVVSGAAGTLTTGASVRCDYAF
jgi:uncharacterized protein YcbX